MLLPSTHTHSLLLAPRLGQRLARGLKLVQQLLAASAALLRAVLVEKVLLLLLLVSELVMVLLVGMLGTGAAADLGQLGRRAAAAG